MQPMAKPGLCVYVCACHLCKVFAVSFGFFFTLTQLLHIASSQLKLCVFSVVLSKESRRHIHSCTCWT